MDTALKLKALVFKVAGWSAAPKSAAGIACFSEPNGLTQLLGRVDMLVVLPLTEATRTILNASLFARLKRGEPLGGVPLINAGRGSLQVEADILAALNSGALDDASRGVRERATADGL
jgi:glyoxylate/hydroxypyruvate reductase